MKNFFFRSRALREQDRFFRENAAQGKPLCLMDDLVFKAMFTSDTEDSREALRHLLGACIKREISSVRVINNELIPAHLDAKTVRLDVNVTFNDGEVADMEMQMGKSDDNLKTRAAYYAAMLLSGQSKRGAPYKAVKRVYQIFFLNFVLFPGSERIPRRYKLMEVNEHDNLTEAVEIIFYELPKLEEHVKNYFKGKAGMETLSEDEKWCIYLKYRHEENAEPLIMELCRKEEGIMRAEKTVEKISRDYLRYVREMNIAKNEYERGVMLETAREEGLAEGRTKGLAEGLAEGHAKGRTEGFAKGRTEGFAKGRTEGRNEEKLEIARKMKNSGRPVSEIEEFTGLSSQTIKNL